MMKMVKSNKGKKQIKLNSKKRKQQTKIIKSSKAKQRPKNTKLIISAVVIALLVLIYLAHHFKFPPAKFTSEFDLLKCDMSYKEVVQNMGQPSNTVLSFHDAMGNLQGPASINYIENGYIMRIDFRWSDEAKDSLFFRSFISDGKGNKIKEIDNCN